MVYSVLPFNYTHQVQFFHNLPELVSSLCCFNYRLYRPINCVIHYTYAGSTIDTVTILDCISEFLLSHREV